MFTGIITDIGTVRSVAPTEGGVRLEIATRYKMDDVAMGASIACAGVCLTVTEKTAASFTADVSKETLEKTHIAQWQQGTQVNLERALKVGDELGGHMVSGHVDGLAEMVEKTPKGDNAQFDFLAPKELEAFVAQKGSVTIDGVSLTVNAVKGNRFSVNIIPHTLEQTTLKNLMVGNRVNLEIDMLARYTQRLMEAKG
jgi:riboflavin synthase